MNRPQLAEAALGTQGVPRVGIALLLFTCGEVAEVAVRSTPDEGDVSVDGVHAGKSPTTVFVDPGTHTIEAKSGASVGTDRRDYSAGTHVDVAIALKGKGPDGSGGASARGKYSEGEVFGHAVDKGYTKQVEGGQEEDGTMWMEELRTHREPDGRLIVDGTEPVGGTKGHPGELGGTTCPGRVQLLHDYGVEAEDVPQNLGNIAQATAEGKGIILSADAHYLWRDSTKYQVPPLGAGHAVNVTGVKYGADGKLESVTVADTGIGECCHTIPARVLDLALDYDTTMNVTKAPVWR